MSIEVTSMIKGALAPINQVVEVMLVDNSTWWQVKRRILLSFPGLGLVGLAQISATSSGLKEPPTLQCRTPSRHHLELQDRRDYTPADRAARTCWLGCPGLCTIWRPETQNSAFLLYPHGRFLQDPTSPVQRSSKSSNPAQVPVFPGSSPLCHHTNSENPSDTASFHSVLVCHRTSSSQKNKDNKLNTKKK
ncbi:hypothetical protein TNCV_3762541 [Trichonephila clavipes]|nr:hypothetical protein TNCV_3762541 [Trichonephila clavipes]